VVWYLRSCRFLAARDWPSREMQKVSDFSTLRFAPSVLQRSTCFTVLVKILVIQSFITLVFARFLQNSLSLSTYIYIIIYNYMYNNICVCMLQKCEIWWKLTWLTHQLTFVSPNCPRLLASEELAQAPSGPRGPRGSRVGLRYLLRLKSTLDVNFNASTFGHTCEHRQTGVYLRLAMLRKLRGKKICLTA
jgi:hypothetical protein